MPHIANVRIEHGVGKNVIIVEPGKPVPEDIKGADLDRLVGLGYVRAEAEPQPAMPFASSDKPGLPDPTGSEQN